MNLTYTTVGNYQIPNLILGEQPEGFIGKYGRMRKKYLKEYRKGVYNGMLLNGTLTQHLIDTETGMQEEMEKLISKMAKQEGVTEQVKANDPMLWLKRMNSIRNRAEEILRDDWIYC